MTTDDIKAALDLDQPLWVRLTGTNRIWRYGGYSNGRHTALHNRDGLVRYFQPEEVREVFSHVQPGDAAYLPSNWLKRIGRQ